MCGAHLHWRQSLRFNVHQLDEYSEPARQQSWSEKYCAGRDYPDLGTIYTYISNTYMY